jgi:hypothetical protein
MHFVSRDPMDRPAPPTVDDVSKLFTVPVMAFIPQPSLSELGVGTIGSSLNGGPTTLNSVAISYTLWRNPGDREDPANLVELSDSQRESRIMGPTRPLPDWLIERRDLMRFSTLWEAVTTTRVRGTDWQTPKSTLVSHINHILTNTFREQRVVGGFPGELDSPVTEKHIEYFAVPVDGVEVTGMRIDTDPHVYGVGVSMGDRIVTAVVARDHLPYVTVAFATRSLPPAGD